MGSFSLGFSKKITSLIISKQWNGCSWREKEGSNFLVATVKDTKTKAERMFH